MIIDLLSSRNWGQWHNTGSADIGPFGVFAIKSTLVRDEDIIVSGEQPSDTFQTEYGVNGPFPVAADGYGVYQNGVEVQVAYDGDEPSVGDEFGPKSGQGTVIKKFPSCYTCMGIVRSDEKIMLARMHSVNPVMIAWATTSAAVAVADSTFTVTSVTPFDGTTWTGEDPLTVTNDGYEIDSGAKGKIISCVNSSGAIKWHPLDFPCTSES